MNQIQKIQNGVLNGNLDDVIALVKNELESRRPVDEILNLGLIPAMDEVGRLFEVGEFFVPEMLIAARAMQGGLDILKPLLAESGIEPVGKVAIGTVKGDLHDIGKNLVAIMLEGAGFEIIDLGTNVPPERFVNAARDGANIIGLSALLTTTMPAMQTTIEALQNSGLRDQVKVMVGGASVTSSYAQDIGADGYASDAGQAVVLAKSFLD